jgi:uncharacterized membrane protein
MVGMGLGSGFLGLLLVFLFWVGLVVLAGWLMGAMFQRNIRPPTSLGGRQSDARAITENRHMQGEVSRDQYQLMKQDLR